MGMITSVFFRIVFDLKFVFLSVCIVILLATIQGLILDAFGKLRDQLLTDSFGADLKSNCSICGIAKDLLDRVSRGFNAHV